ncbi:MAG: 4-hydroxy-tetrahydrodipicolinate reductase [Peptococcaceae bacterium]|nr:4-hydroxy-tetrahydrodipicolinate reductase [Peptococcaceae bacterium]
MHMIKVVVAGAAGKMGREVMRAVWKAEDTELVGAVDPFAEGTDIGALMETGETGIAVRSRLNGLLDELKPDVLIDFTTPESVYKNVCAALERGVRPVVGTTGMTAGQLDDIREMASGRRIGCIVAPNFAIGAVLMMKFASEACKYFPHVEIIELHHDKKIDAPSGTAVKTAEVINQSRGRFRQGKTAELEKLAGVRGGKFDDGLRIHSVRLPGLMAHQEVIFGGLGQTLTIRHDSISRESFMPGVLLAVRKVMELEEMVYGLENIIFNNCGASDG